MKPVRTNQKKLFRVYLMGFAILVIFLMSGCAIQLAKPIDEKIENIVPVAQVRQNPENYVNSRIRWGGVIAGISNEKQTTLVEIVSRPLSSEGRPIDSDDSEGRFLARINGFLDPVIFANGRDVTVVGTITGSEKRLINEFDYNYPLVQVDNFKLWQTIDDRPAYYYDPFWYGPWYPYYGRHNYPYWYRKAPSK